MTRALPDIPEAGPANAQSYVKYLEEVSGVKASIIAVGPDRNQTIFNGWESR